MISKEKSSFLFSSVERCFKKLGSRSPKKIFLYGSADSTNERAKRYPDGQAPDKELSFGSYPAMLFVAEGQTSGRGRMGKSFVSNHGKGLYMSLRLELDIPLSEACLLTPYAAVAVCRALEKSFALRPKIKWVNDIYIGSKKLAGILTEGVPRADGCTVIIGIGLNVKKSELPRELDGIATSLEDEGVTADAAELCALITDGLLSGIDSYRSASVLDEYRSHSYLLGMNVNVLSPSSVYPARVVGIGERFELIVITESGEIKYLSDGDVSVRQSL